MPEPRTSLGPCTSCPHGCEDHLRSPAVTVVTIMAQYEIVPATEGPELQRQPTASRWRRTLKAIHAFLPLVGSLLSLLHHIGVL